MGLRPTRGNENHPCCHPRVGGGPRHQDELDSRLRGNDCNGVIFSRVPQARDDEESRTASKTLRARFLAPLGMTA
jgi:hypothetical protein